MGVICGVIFKNSERKVLDIDLTPMMKELTIKAEYQRNSHVDSQAGFATVNSPGRNAELIHKIIGGKTIVLAFHGNIYEIEGLLFKIRYNDSIVGCLIDLYVEIGIDFVKKIRGDFSLSIWDGRNEVLHLISDRFRVIPLFYYHDKEKIVFSTRLKSLLFSPLVLEKTIDHYSIADFISNSVIPGPNTILREVKKIAPATVIEFKKGDVSFKSYWQVKFIDKNSTKEEELIRQLKYKFEEAVSCCYEYDRDQNEVGTFLSGGIDSSTILAVLTELCRKEISCFSIGFTEERYNELLYARIAANKYRSNHFEHYVTANETYDNLKKIVEGFDEPYGNASAVSTYFCANKANEKNIDVLYGGDGGDELFAGNERYATQYIFELYNKVPKIISNGFIDPLVRRLSNISNDKISLKAKKYIDRANIPYSERISSYDFMRLHAVEEVFSDELIGLLGQSYDPYRQVKSYFSKAPAHSNLNRHLYVDWNLTLSDNDLQKFRMTELSGIPVRFPFLDYKLAEFSCTIPPHLKMKLGKLRYLFKKTYRDILPKEIIKKKKHGFGLPIAMWLKKDVQLKDLMEDLVFSSRSLDRGYFKREGLRKLYDIYQKDKTPYYGTFFWYLIVLELWHRRTFENL